MVKVVNYTYHDPKVNSTAISEIWYSSTTRELFVRFAESGQIAGYSDVSPVAADKLVDAHSVGSYYARYIKPNYKGINTADVEFRAAPGLAKKTTDKKTYGGQPMFPKATPAPGVYTPTQTVPKKTFRVSGTVLKPTAISDDIVASSMEEAMELFRKKYADRAPDVTGVFKN